MYVLGVNKENHKLLLKRFKCNDVSKLKVLNYIYEVEFWSKDKQAVISYVLQYYEGWPINDESDSSLETDDSAC